LFWGFKKIFTRKFFCRKSREGGGEDVPSKLLKLHQIARQIIRRRKKSKKQRGFPPSDILRRGFVWISLYFQRIPFCFEGFSGYFQIFPANCCKCTNRSSEDGKSRKNRGISLQIPGSASTEHPKTPKKQRESRDGGGGCGVGVGGKKGWVGRQ
jgi:hypothetical protein